MRCYFHIVDLDSLSTGEDNFLLRSMHWLKMAAASAFFHDLVKRNALPTLIGCDRLRFKKGSKTSV